MNEAHFRGYLNCIHNGKHISLRMGPHDWNKSVRMSSKQMARLVGEQVEIIVRPVPSSPESSPKKRGDARLE